MRLYGNNEETFFNRVRQIIAVLDLKKKWHRQDIWYILFTNTSLGIVMAYSKMYF